MRRRSDPMGIAILVLSWAIVLVVLVGVLVLPFAQCYANGGRPSWHREAWSRYGEVRCTMP